MKFVVGTPGGLTIITRVAQVLIAAIDYGDDDGEANDASGSTQHLPDRIDVEPFGLSQDTVDRLSAMGHTVRFRNGYSGRVETIEVDFEHGFLFGRSDLRGGGLADGF